MTTRLANEMDVELTYGWASDPLVRRNSYSKGTITLAGHKQWFLNKLTNDEALFFIIELDGIEIGLVRFEGSDDHFVIGITVAPNERGKGYASKMLKTGLKEYSKKWKKPVYAYIKIDNLASIKAFERAGFDFEKNLRYLGTLSKSYIWR